MLYVKIITMLSNPFNLTEANVLIVGEYASANERKTNISFNGSTGKHLIDTLSKVGFDPTTIYYEPLLEASPPRGKMDDLFITKTAAKGTDITELHGKYPKPQLVRAREKIQALITRLKPKLIISLGDVPMWAVGGISGSSVTWNGSMESYKTSNFMPVISPITVQRMWSFNIYFEHALRKAAAWQTERWSEPKYNFTLQPTFTQARNKCEKLLARLDERQTHISCDLETRERHIACLGLAWSELDSICIPFMKAQLPCAYWSPEQEVSLVLLLKKILTHPNAQMSGQNYNYDRQYLARYWGFVSNLGFDTMTLHHTRNPDLKKGLDTLSFLYLPFYRYWKEESKDWDPKLGELQLWRYNCLDCVMTWAIAERLRNRPIASDPFYQFQHEMQAPVLAMTLRGTLCDLEAKDRMTKEVKLLMKEREEWFFKIAGYNVRSKSKKPWWSSYQQIGNLLYDVMKIRPVYKKSGNKQSRTTDDAALVTIARREPLARLLCQKLQEYKSLSVFHNTFLTMDLDHDHRIRCQYMIDGTKTFRFASMSDAFHYGTNLQNIPKGTEK